MGDVGDDAGAAGFSESNAGLDFGEHGAGGEIIIFDEIFEVFSGNVGDGLLIFEAIINKNIWYGGDGNENVGLDAFS